MQDEETLQQLTPFIKDQIHLLLCENLNIFSMGSNQGSTLLSSQAEDEIEAQLKGVVFVNTGRNLEQVFSPQQFRLAYYKLMDSLDYKMQTELRYFYLEFYQIPQSQQEFESDFQKHQDYYVFENSTYLLLWNTFKTSTPNFQQAILAQESLFAYLKQQESLNYQQIGMDFIRHKDQFPCTLQKFIKEPFYYKVHQQTLKYHVTFKVYVLIESVCPLICYISDKALVNFRQEPFFFKQNFCEQYYQQKNARILKPVRSSLNATGTEQTFFAKENLTFQEFKTRMMLTDKPFNEKEFWQQVSSQTIFSILCTYPQYSWLQGKSYQLLQFQFTLDENMDAWLCKINTKVKFEESGNQKIDKHKKEILHDLLRQVERRVEVKICEEKSLLLREDKATQKKKYTAMELRNKMVEEQKKQEIKDKIRRYKEFQRVLFNKIDIERAKIRSHQKQVISFKDINQCLTSREKKDIPIYYQHKQGNSAQMAKSLQNIIKSQSTSNIKLFHNISSKHPDNILKLNQQIEKMKELQQDAKPLHVNLLENLLFSINFEEFKQHKVNLLQEVSSDFDLELAFRKIFQMHCFSLEALTNKHPVLVRVQDDQWVSKWLMKLLYYQPEKPRKQTKKNKFLRFLSFLEKRLLKKEKQEAKVEQSENDSLDGDEDKVMEKLNQYKRRKFFQVQKVKSSTTLFQRLQTNELSEYFDDEYEAGFKLGKKRSNWIQQLRSEDNDGGSSDISSDVTMDYHQQRQMSSALQFADIAHKLGVIKQRTIRKVLAQKKSKSQKKGTTFFGEQVSSSEDDGQTKLAEDMQTNEKLNKFQTEVRQVMDKYNIPHNLETYNLTENEKDLKLRNLQKSQSSMSIRRKLLVTPIETDKQALLPRKALQTPITQIERVSTTSSMLKTVRLQQVTPREASPFRLDYLHEMRIAKQRQQSKPDIPPLQLSKAASSLIKSQVPKVSNLRNNILKLLQRKKLLMAEAQQNHYNSTNHNIDLNLNENFNNNEKAHQNQSLYKMNEDIFGQAQFRYQHFHKLLPFNKESENVLKDLDQLAIKFNYFELVLITKKIIKLAQQFDFKQNFQQH